jgi:hypothetical protein
MNPWDTNNVENITINCTNFCFSAKAARSGVTRLVLLVLERYAGGI